MSAPIARTIVYIDGFNLYYRALKHTNHKWLDLVKLSMSVLPGFKIDRINYYTARVSGRLDPTSPSRQHAYLRALATLPDVAIHYGNFLASEKWAGLVQPPRFKPAVILPPGVVPKVAWGAQNRRERVGRKPGRPPCSRCFQGVFRYGRGADQRHGSLRTH